MAVVYTPRTEIEKGEIAVAGGRRQESEVRWQRSGAVAELCSSIAASTRAEIVSLRSDYLPDTVLTGLLSLTRGASGLL